MLVLGQMQQRELERPQKKEVRVLQWRRLRPDVHDAHRTG